MKKIFTLIVLVLLSLSFAQDRADWQSLELTNAVTGETFTFADFDGKVAFVEPMATWCTNCRSQLKTVTEVSEQTGEDVVYVALSIEGNLADEKLAEYAERQGFPFIFAVVSQEVLQGLVDEFGRIVTSPPSTPHFLISADGSLSEIYSGRHSAEELLEQIAAAGG